MLIASAAENNVDIMCVKQHRYYYGELDLKHHESRNGWTYVSEKNCINPTIKDIKMLSPH